MRQTPSPGRDWTVRALGNALESWPCVRGKGSPLTLENAKVTFWQQEKTNVGKWELQSELQSREKDGLGLTKISSSFYGLNKRETTTVRAQSSYRLV